MSIDKQVCVFRVDDDTWAGGRLCALSRFSGIRREYEILTYIGEDDARDLIAKLTAWLDAQRLVARKMPMVVASVDGYKLLRTSAGEWGTMWCDNEGDHDDDRNDGDVVWHASEAEARTDYEDSTGQRRCESCGEYRDRGDLDVDPDGIYTCADPSACKEAP